MVCFLVQRQIQGHLLKLLKSGKDLKSSGWILSQAQRDSEFKYEGIWSIEKATVLVGKPDNHGLVLKSGAKHHAISKKLSHPIDMKNKKVFVVQYDVKLQKGLECGGAYMKLLTFDPNYDPESFTEKTPYTLMFGPDRCGSTNKVHFIFRHQNPISKEIEEKHLKSGPLAMITKTSNLYTLIVREDNSFEILVNQVSLTKGNLLEDFKPSVNPEKIIEDPSDQKPTNWVDQVKIPDPQAKKPFDWDEDEPAMILDEDATKPSDWLEDEPDMISDPSESQPEDWDEETDGTWFPSSIPNPECIGRSGCGSWVPPLKDNPKYKGKWTRPLIDNPDYKGPWEARKIPNPNYFEDIQPYKFSKIGAVGFELWTMQSDIMFDNIYIGHSIEEADRLAKKEWMPKYEIESALEKAEAEEDRLKVQHDTEDELDATLGLKLRSTFKALRKDFDRVVKRFRYDPIETIKKEPQTLALFVGIFGFPFFLILFARSFFAGKSKSTPVIQKKVSETHKSNGTVADAIRNGEVDQLLSSTPGTDEKLVKRTNRKKTAE